MSPTFVMIRRWVQLFVGLFLYGFAIAMMIRAGLGLSPWDVLAQGISIRTGIQFGIVTVMISGVVLLLWIPLRERLGVGTVLNGLLIGPFADLGLFLLSDQTELWAQILMFTGGLLLLAIATGMYIGARFGPGPRDGLMTGIHRRFGVRIWIVRTSIEVVVLSIGWILGGTVGFGTLAFALLIGPLVHRTMPLLLVPAALSPAAQSAMPSENQSAAAQTPPDPGQ